MDNDALHSTSPHCGCWSCSSTSQASTRDPKYANPHIKPLSRPCTPPGSLSNNINNTKSMYGVDASRLAAFIQSIPPGRPGPIRLLSYDFYDDPQLWINNPPGPRDLYRIAKMMKEMDKEQEERELEEESDTEDDGQVSETSQEEFMAHGRYDFGGPCYDFEKRRWVVGHVIENDGTIGTRYANDDLAEITDDTSIDSEKGLAKICETGLAAGKLYLHEGHEAAAARKWASFTCSGFCFEKRFFLTTVHFDPSCEAALEHASCHSDAIAKISTTRSSEFAGKSNSRIAHLIGAHRPMDIAIFRLDDKEEDFKHYLTFNDLLAADSHDYSANFAGKRVWTVGYAAPRSKRFKKHFKRLVEVWKQDPVKGELWDGSAQGPPDFDKIYHPNERILALGRLGEKTPSVIGEIQQEAEWLHSIPGWFGMSGSMIGILGQRHNQTKIQIFGFYKGGPPSTESNTLVAFTSSHIRWIIHKITPAP